MAFSGKTRHILNLSKSEQFERLNIDVFGMAFSPQCNDDELADPDHLCPDSDFFDNIFGRNIFNAPGENLLLFTDSNPDLRPGHPSNFGPSNCPYELSFV